MISRELNIWRGGSFTDFFRTAIVYIFILFVFWQLAWVRHILNAENQDMHFFSNVLLLMCQFNTQVVVHFYYTILDGCILLYTLIDEASNYIHALTSPSLLFNLYTAIFNSQVTQHLLCSVSSKQPANIASLNIYNQILILCKTQNVSKARLLNCNLTVWYEIF